MFNKDILFLKSLQQLDTIQSNQDFLTTQKAIDSIKTDDVPEIHKALQRLQKKVQLAAIVSLVTGVLALVILIMSFVQ